MMPLMPTAMVLLILVTAPVVVLQTQMAMAFLTRQQELVMVPTTRTVLAMLRTTAPMVVPAQTATVFLTLVPKLELTP